MNAAEFRSLIEAIGLPLALVLFIFFVLVRNGWFKVIMRDEKRDELDALRASIDVNRQTLVAVREDNRERWREHGKLQQRIADLERDVAVLKDRSNNGRR